MDTDTTDNTYTCARCRKTYEYGRPDGEALAEKDALWPDVPLDECDIICDDCFRTLMQKRTPRHE